MDQSGFDVSPSSEIKQELKDEIDENDPSHIPDLQDVYIDNVSVKSEIDIFENITGILPEGADGNICSLNDLKETIEDEGKNLFIHSGSLERLDSDCATGEDLGSESSGKREGFSSHRKPSHRIEQSENNDQGTDQGIEDGHKLSENSLNCLIEENLETTAADEEGAKNSEGETNTRNIDYRQVDFGGMVISKVYLCFVCDQEFIDKAGLRSHMNIHKEDKGTDCSFHSSEVKVSKSAVKNLIKSVGETDEAKELTCPMCNQLFSTDNEWKAHIEMHAKDRPFQCHQCDKAFRVKTHLKRHLLIHSEKKRHVCPVCGKGYSRKEDMKKHTRIHELKSSHTHNDDADGEYKSYLDDFGLRNGGTKTKKKIQRKSMGGTLIFCSVCNKMFCSPSQLVIHTRTHTGEKPFKCSICDVSFCQKVHLSRHILTHSEEKPNVCPVCNKGFRRKDDLIKHKQIHFTGEEDVCPFCHRVFGGSRTLERHMKVHTRERKPHKCSVCDKGFDRLSALTIHMRCHTREKPNVCSICGKAFSTRNHLKKHTLVHTGEKHHQCNICNKAFNSSNYLQRHARIHTGEKPHMCSLCGKTFTWLNVLRNHMRAHSGERPVKCSLCTRSFAKNHQLKMHMKSHSGEKPHKCSVCDKAFSDRRTLTNHMLRHKAQKHLVTIGP